ncbi:hypothetical protein JW992_03730 [candidate division KSB1 bacterium]|nr:hypothetical protein [candidate division KSB1 bacterium]
MVVRMRLSYSFATCAVLFLCSATPGFSESVDGLEWLPKPDFAPNWAYDFPPEVYTPDNLFEMINGEADLYLAYGFELLYSAAYIDTTHARHSLSVDLFCMDSPLHAFGIYSVYRNPEYRFIDIGAQGYLSDYSLRFYQGRHVVQINAGSNDSTLQALMVRVAERISRNLSSTNEHIAELDLLPLADQVPNTAALIVQGFLGQSVFGPTLQALFVTAAGDSAVGFVIMQMDSAQAQKAAKVFRQDLESRGSVHDCDLKVGDAAVLCGEVPYQGGIMLARSDRYLLGALRFNRDSAGQMYVKRLAQHLTDRLGE